MYAGELKHRIEVQRSMQGENELGELGEEEFVLFKKVWAKIIPQTAQLQAQQAETILTNITHKIVVRYTVGKMFNKEMRIVFRNKMFEIKYLSNPFYDDEFMEMYCVEVLE